MSKSFQSMTQLSNEKRQIISIPIEDGLISLRGLSPKRLRFEIEYALERGSTANSFLFSQRDQLVGETKAAILIHPPGDNYANAFLTELKKSLDPNAKKLIVVIGHVNPNRVSFLHKLVDAYSEVTLICSNPGTKLLRELWHQKKPSKTTGNQEVNKNLPKLPKIHTVKDQEVISIENKYELQLIPAPTARWPGGLLVFEKNLGLLMSNKFFAAHLCTTEWAEANRSSTEEERRHYFDCLMASMSNQVDALVDRLQELDIRTIAPGHGPAIEASWRSLMNDYQRWGEGQQKSALKVILLFASAYGNTAAIADALAKGISRTGVQVQSHNCEFTPADELISTIRNADAYLIGSPTLGGHAPTPIVSALGTLLAEGDREKPVGVFGSYGWSGEALELLENKLRDGGFKFGFEPIKVKFSPNAAMIKMLEETGTLFGRNLFAVQKRNLRRTTGGLSTSKSDPKILALGRIVGSLCVLTARKGNESEELSGAMVASWVSQASFSPPGITIAVAKDRAVEALLHKGDHFTLNVLAAGRQHELMRQFLQPFPAGANRFANLQLNASPSNQPILPDALAWIEGCVKQRMECGDHWLIYAEIHHGKVLDQEGTTAVHYRRTGATY